MRFGGQPIGPQSRQRTVTRISFDPNRERSGGRVRGRLLCATGVSDFASRARHFSTDCRRVKKPHFSTDSSLICERPGCRSCHRNPARKPGSANRRDRHLLPKKGETSMSRKVGQIIARGERRWLVRVYLGRDCETRLPQSNHLRLSTARTGIPNKKVARTRSVPRSRRASGHHRRIPGSLA